MKSGFSHGRIASMDTDYRLVRTGDAPLLLDFMRQVAGDTDNLATSIADIDAMDVKDEELFIAELKRAMDVFVLAIADEKVIGTCEIRMSRRLRTKHRGELAIAVRKEFWGKGVAGHLLEFAIDEAKERGVTKLNLETRIDNERAKAFFAKNGFVSEGNDSELLFIDGEYIDGERFGKII